MVVKGSYDVDYSIYVACRNGFTYKIKNGLVSQNFVVHIESKPMGLIKLDRTLVIGGINQNLYSFYLKGRLNFMKKMPAEIADLCKVDIRKQTNF